MSRHTTRKPTSPADGTTGNVHQPLSKTEVRSRIDAFVAGAENGSTLSECPACLDVFIIELLGNATLLEYALSTSPSFFETALRLIILLANLNVPALRIRLVANQRHCIRRMTHKGRVGRLHADAVYTLLDALCLLISCGLRGGPNPLVSPDAAVSKKHFCKRKGMWPRGLKDLFPAGLEQTLDALVFWACVPFSDAPFKLVQEYLSIARPVVVDALLSAPRRERLAWATLQALTSQSSVPPWPENVAVPFAPRAGLTIPPGLRGSDKMVDAALVFLFILWAGLDGRRDEPPRFLAGLEAQFRGALLQDFPDNILKEHKNTISRYFFMVSDHGLVSCAPGAASRALTAHNYVMRFSTGYRCSGPGCSRHELGGLEESDGSPERFARCANCKVTRYCNQTCQRAHWKKATPPHRDVCEVLCRLIEHGVDLSASDSAPFVAAYNKLSSDDAELLFQAAVSATIIPYNPHLA